MNITRITLSFIAVAMLTLSAQAINIHRQDTSQIIKNDTIAARKDTVMLEEVTIESGYQTISKERATGSYVTIGSDNLLQQVHTNVLDGLHIIAGGVSLGRQTGSGGQLMVRGLSTLQGPKDPLIIVDNFPYEGDLDNINPNDVANITILKDAAAASIWGARAANGVIVITTKKGHFRQPTRIELHSNLKLTSIPDLHYQRPLPSSEVIDVERFLFGHQYRFTDTAHYSRPAFSEAYELMFLHKNGKLTDGELEAQLAKLANYDIYDEYTRTFYRTGANQQYAVTLRGGNESLAWAVAGGFDRNKDNLDAGYQRLSLRTNQTYRVSDRISIQTGLNFTQGVRTTGKPRLSDLSLSEGERPPYAHFVDDSGAPLPYYRDYRQVYIDTLTDEGLLDWRYFPATDYLHDTQKNTSQNLTGQISTHINLLAGVNAVFNYQFQQERSDMTHLADKDSYYARDYINQRYQPATGTYPVPIGGIMDRSAGRLSVHNLRGQFNVDKGWQDHRIVGIVGGETRALNNLSHQFRQYGYDKEITTSVTVDHAQRFTNFVTGRQSAIESRISESSTATRYVSIYGNASYTYKNRYTLSGSARRDASNIFGVSTNRKWTPLWSSGVSWDVSKEPFYNIPALSVLKLRATYGYSGNVDPSMTAVTTFIYSLTSPYTRMATARIDRFHNPELRWEKNRQINIGVDFSVFNNRISGSMDFYFKRGIDLYGPSELDYTAGLARLSITKNAASMRSKGLDIELNTVNTRGALRWTSSLLTNLYRDRVTDYYLIQTSAQGFVGQGNVVTGAPDKSVHALYSYRWAGLDPTTGDPRGYLPDGSTSSDYNKLMLSQDVTVDDLVYHGSDMPTLFGSLGNTFQWRGLSLACYVSYKFGHYFRRPSINYNSLISDLRGHVDFLDRWQTPGDEMHTDVPSMVYPIQSRRDNFYYGSEILVSRADNIRFEYIRFGYSPAPRLLAPTGLTKLEIYATAQNLGVIWAANGYGIDPDFANNTIPAPLTIAMGLRLEF